MTGAHELLVEAVRDEWADPVDVARRVCRALIELTESDWAGEGVPAAYHVRRSRADTPLVLAATEPAMTDRADHARRHLTAVLEQLDDTTWTTDLGLRVAHHPSLGVLSVDDRVIAVLEAAIRLGGSTAELYTDRRAVARGLGYLGSPVAVAPPEEAAALLLPALAMHRSTVWTTPRMADIALAAAARDRPVVPVVHPAACFSAISRAAFRPPAQVIEVRIPLSA